MRRILSILVSAGILAWTGRCIGQTRAATAPSDVPDVALHGDLLGVGEFDLVKGDKTAWTNAWLVIAGAKSMTRPVRTDEPLPIGLDQALGPIFSSGADRFVYADAAASSGQDITLCFHLPPTADVTAAEKSLRRLLPSQRFARQDQWLVTRFNTNGGSAASVASEPISPQAGFVREALDSGPDLPVRAVYVTNDAVKRMLMRNGPPPAEFRGLANLYWSAKYVYLGVTLGSHPQVKMRWVAPDENGADAVIKEFLKTREALERPDNRWGMPAFVSRILDQAQPVREHNVAEVTLGQKELSNIFAIVVAASMNGGNSAGEQAVRQEPVSPDWKPLDPATDSAEAEMRLILSAIVEYDADHQALPASLDDLLSDKLLPGPEIFRDPRTGKDKGFIYVKPGARLADIGNRDKTAILFEDKDGRPHKNGLMGYADGRVGTRN